MSIYPHLHTNDFYNAFSRNVFKPSHLHYKRYQPLHWLATVSLLFILSLMTITSAQATSVSVSNYPLFLLSNAVTAGTTPAKRILEAGDVGHHSNISPGDIKTIQDSTLVVWFGAALESNLAATLDTAPNAISLFDFDAFNRHTLRDTKGEPIANTFDPHIWLDPENAKAIVRALAVIHTHANPQHSALYQANAKDFSQRLDATVAAQQTSSKKQQPYWVYHDAYQYIEASTQLTLKGSLSIDHHLAPKASQLRWLNENRPAKQMCLVAQSEPAKGLLAKLQPIKSTVQAEDMSDYKDFISGWTTMAQQIKKCIS